MDPSVSVFQWVIVIILILFSFFSSIIETAIVSCSKVKLQNLVESGSNRAKKAILLKDNQKMVLATCLVANNIANITVSSVVTAIISIEYSSKVVGIATGVLTFVIMIFSEVTPKNIASKYPEKVCLIFCDLIKIMTTILTPIAIVVDFFSSVILKLFRIDMNRDVETFTEEEIKTIVDISHEEGILETEEKEIIKNVFDLDEITIKEIMIPRADMTFVKSDLNYDDLLDVFRQELYTRLPVYYDTKDNVIGVLNIKDLLVKENFDKNNFRIKDIMRKPFFVYENRKVSDVLKDMKKNTFNFAIVLDEYGITSGMVTMEDILEEIVGDLRDEYDKDEDEEIRKVSDNHYIIKGYMKIDDINDRLNTNIVKNDDFDSIGGMVLQKLDHIPKVGDDVDYEGYHLRVLQMDNNRIVSVDMKLPEGECGNEEKN